MNRTLSMIAAVVTVGGTVFAAGCGDGSTAAEPANPANTATIVAGDVVYQDTLTDNTGGWFTFEDKVLFKDGAYVVAETPPKDAASGGASAPDALAVDRIPAGVEISVSMTNSNGDSLRGLSCRAFAPAGAPPTEGYELAVDGRLALIRKLEPGKPPAVLAKADVPIANDVKARLTAQCVDDGKGGYLMVLQVDGKEVVRATDGSPFPPSRTGGDTASGDLRFYTRADSAGPATIVFADYVMKSAALKPA